MKKFFENKKVVLGIFSSIVAAIVIGVTSFFPFILDFNNLGKEFITNEIIIIAITISGMISWIFISQAINAKDKESNLAKAKVRFMETFKLITNRNSFKQWVKRVLQPKDLLAIKVRKLRSLGIDKDEYLDLSIPEIKALLDTPQKYNNIWFKSLTKEQVQGLIKIKTNRKQIVLVEPEYYLTFNNIESEKTISEKSGNEGKKKASIVSLDLIGKIVATVTTAVVFGSLLLDANSGIGMEQAWLNFAARMWALISSSFFGFTIGAKINDIDAEYIGMRSEVHIQFSEDKTFVPLSYEEEAKEQFKERVLKEEHALLIEHKE